MKPPMTIRTHDGLLTSTKWFSQIIFEGDNIVAVTDPRVGEVQSIVLAIVPDQVERNVLYEELHIAVNYEKRMFEVPLSTDTALAE